MDLSTLAVAESGNKIALAAVAHMRAADGSVERYFWNGTLTLTPGNANSPKRGKGH